MKEYYIKYYKIMGNITIKITPLENLSTEDSLSTKINHKKKKLILNRQSSSSEEEVDNNSLKNKLNIIMKMMNKDYFLNYKWKFLAREYENFDYSNYSECLVMYIALNYLLFEYLSINNDSPRIEYSDTIHEIQYTIDKLIKIDIDPFRETKESSIEFSIDKLMFFIDFHCIRSFMDKMNKKIFMMKTMNIFNDYEAIQPYFEENMETYIKDIVIDNEDIDIKLFNRMLKNATRLRFKNYFYTHYFDNVSSQLLYNIPEY